MIQKIEGIKVHTSCITQAQHNLMFFWIRQKNLYHVTCSSHASMDHHHKVHLHQEKVEELQWVFHNVGIQQTMEREQTDRTECYPSSPDA